MNCTEITTRGHCNARALLVLTSLPSSSPSLKLVNAVNMRGRFPCCCLLAMPIKIKMQLIPVNTYPPYPPYKLGKIKEYKKKKKMAEKKDVGTGDRYHQTLFLLLSSGRYSPSTPSQIRSTCKVPARSQGQCVLLAPCSHEMKLSRERLDLYRSNEQWVPKSHLFSLQPRIDMCVREIFQRENAFSVCS